MNSFFLTLPSNSSDQNTQSTFITQLIHPFELEGEWEVGLAEVHLCQTWYNVTSSNNFYHVAFGKMTKDGRLVYTDPPKSVIDCQIPIGRYTSVDMLFREIRKVFPNLSEANPLHLHQNIDGTVSFESKAGVKWSDGLREILGFTASGFMRGKQKGKYPAELQRGVYGIYVYTDLIQPYCVGNSFAQLLRVLPVSDDKNGRLVVYTYDSPDYFPLARNSFDRIEIYLRTDTGETILFPSGKTLVKLHFRRVGK